MFFRRVGELSARFKWVILGAWMVLGLVLNVAVPQLTDVIREGTTPFIPDASPVSQAYKQMGEKFTGSNAAGFAIVVLENPSGLTQADRDFYADLVKRIGGDKRVAFIQDYLAHPELKDAVVSKDGKALYIPVGLHAAVGSPHADDDATWLRNIVTQGKPSRLTAYVTADTAIIADFQHSVQDSTARTTAFTMVLLILILLAIYRSPVTPIIPLTTIGLSIMVVRPVVALLGLHFIHVAAFTETFILAIVFGAGTDYCIFMISRYKEQMARGDGPSDAIATTSHRVGEAITSSAGTVIVGGLAMSTASVALFSTTGPAIAAAVAVTLVAGLTLTPALIAIGGDRFFWPQKVRVDRVSRFWTRASEIIVSRPRRVLGIALVPLLLMAAIYPTMRLSYDERGPQPKTNGSVQGLAALDRHYSTGEVLPGYLLISSDHDLRNPTDLATIDNVTKSISRVPGVASVRSFTQPAGTRIDQASIPYQAGQVGQGLAGARDKIAGSTGQVQQLDDGARQVANGAGQARDATSLFIDGLDKENSGLGQAATGAAAAQSGAARLRDGARQLAAGLRIAADGLRQTDDGLQKVIVALTADPLCQADPVCKRSLDGLRQIYGAQNGQLEPGLRMAVSGADQIASGNGDLAVGLGLLHDGIVQARAGIVQLTDGQKTFRSKLGELASGAGQVSGGVGQVAAGTGQLESGLTQAADYLNTVSREAGAAGLDTFYIPANQLDDPRLALARYYYISNDGTVARIVILGKDDPFGIPAMDRVAQDKAAAHAALAGTRLAGAQVLEAGFASQNDSIRAYFLRDFNVVAIAVLIGVLLVLVLLLRSLVAPLYLMGSVLLSYAAAMGVTTLLWQDVLGFGAIDWTVPIFAFVMLVAVGADYNIFLMSRVREEVLRDPANGIGRAVRRTGAIITSAGIIFAGTFAALMTSPLFSVAMTGFAITFGLLLDTFVVRSFVVPAVAVLLGKWNWWPHFGMSQAMVESLEHTGQATPASGAPDAPGPGSRPRVQPAN